jgi:hypothetical protein
VPTGSASSGATSKRGSFGELLIDLEEEGGAGSRVRAAEGDRAAVAALQRACTLGSARSCHIAPSARRCSELDAPKDVVTHPRVLPLQQIIASRHIAGHQRPQHSWLIEVEVHGVQE